MGKNIWRLGAGKHIVLNNKLHVIQNILCPTPIPNIFPVSPIFEEEQRSYSTYHQQYHSSNTVRSQSNNNYEVQIPKVDTGRTEEMHQFWDNNHIQETKGKMPVEFKRGAKDNQLINPIKYGYSQAANIILRTFDFNLKDITNWEILDSGATSHFLVTDASAAGVLIAKKTTQSQFQMIPS